MTWFTRIEIRTKQFNWEKRKKIIS